MVPYLEEVCVAKHASPVLVLVGLVADFKNQHNIGVLS